MNMPPLIRALIVLLIGSNIAQASELAICSNAKSHAVERQCLERLSQKAAARLVKAERQAEQHLHDWDEDADYKAKASKQLLAANRSFQHYLAQQCAYELALAAGGNGAGDMKLSCEIELRNQRAKQLEALTP